MKSRKHRWLIRTRRAWESLNTFRLRQQRVGDRRLLALLNAASEQGCRFCIYIADTTFGSAAAPDVPDYLKTQVSWNDGRIIEQ